MAPISRAYDSILRMYSGLFYNPSKRYVTAENETDYMNMAATMLAKDIGGVRTIDTSVTTTASTRQYTFSRSHKRILSAEYIEDFNGANEKITPLDVIDESNANYIRFISSPQGQDDNQSVTLTGSTTDKPKYLLPFYQAGYFWLMDTPNTTGDTLRLFCLSIPSILGAGVTYDGDESEVPAIAFKMAELSHIKMKDFNYANEMQSKYNEQIVQLRGSRFKQTRPRQLGDGRFEHTRLRSINGPR